MIQYSNITRIPGLSFEDYLKLPGASNSYLKGERFGIAKEVPETDKIKIGKFVDAILTDPGFVNMSDPLYIHARNIAYNLQLNFGSIIKRLDKQISYTAVMTYEGYSLQTKARTDFEFHEGIVDLKVTAAKDMPALINHMGYVNQLWHYSRCAQKKNTYLLMYSTALKHAKLIHIPMEYHSEYWATKILKLGTPHGIIQ